MDRQITTLSRRMFLATTSAALVGAAWGSLIPQSEAAKRHPKRGGVLQFGTRTDAAGLDSHRHNQLHTSTPGAAMYTGLTDYDQQGNIIPGIAESWEPNQDLTAWVFRLRKGVLFHNGREVDAEAVKLNLLRIKNPAIGSDWHRGAVDTIESVDVLDKYTVRLNTTMPDVAVPSSVLHYPTNLQAPDNFDNAAEHPIGTGPFKFVSWTRFNETRMVRFENYWETDAEGNNLPYLQARKERAFDGLMQGNTLRFDPHDFYGRNFHSKSEYAHVLSGWQNERYDRLVEEARRTLDPARRKVLYTEAWNIVNVELPHFHLHEVVITSAAVKELRSYQPGATGSFSYHGGGIRTAYIET